jgi:hypothetical protein
VGFVKFLRSTSTNGVISYDDYQCDNLCDVFQHYETKFIEIRHPVKPESKPCCGGVRAPPTPLLIVLVLVLEFISAAPAIPFSLSSASSASGLKAGNTTA